MKYIVALLALCAPMVSCSPAYADESDDIKQCANNGALINEYLLNDSSRLRNMAREVDGNLILMLTQDRVTVGSPSESKALDYWAIHQGLIALKMYPLPEKCTAIVPLSYFKQTEV